MAKRDTALLRAAILEAFTDHKTICSIKDVQNYVSQSLPHKEFKYQAIHYNLKKLALEGRVKELPRDVNNSISYVKVTDGNRFVFTFFGEPVSLKEFLHRLDAMEESGLIKDVPWQIVRKAMFDSITSSYPEPYLQNGIPYPSVGSSRDQLEEFCEVLQKMHKFIKNFLNNNLWTEGDRELLCREIKASCPEEHSAIINKDWS